MSASFLLAAAAAIPDDDLIWSGREVREHLANLAAQLDPGDLIDSNVERTKDRLPLTRAYVGEAIGRLLFRAERAESDYGRCVQIAQLLGDSANWADVKGDHARADLLREYAHAVSKGGNAI